MEALDISVSIKELILIVIISFIGSLLHEYIVSIKKNSIRQKSTIGINITITVLTDTLICLSINQIVSQFSPRLILLPPLIIGLIGKELVETLTTLKSATRFIAFIFSLFGVGKGEGVKTDDNKEETQEEKAQKFQIYTKKVLDDMNALIALYVSNSIDDVGFMMKYHPLKINAKLIKEHVKDNMIVSVDDAIRIAEIVKNEDYLDRISADIMSKYEIIS